MVMQHSQAIFTTRYEEVIRLPGDGEYTAAAMAYFTANEPKAVVDGNVYRVLARYLGIQEPINTSSGKRLFARLAQEMLDVHNPRAYNQAIMDFGALQCKPKKPLCEECVFRLDCRALQENN